MATIYRTDNQTGETSKFGEYWTRSEALNMIAFLIERDYAIELEKRIDTRGAFYLGKTAAYDISAVNNASNCRNKFLSFQSSYRIED